jgi:hypothetical protein
MKRTLGAGLAMLVLSTPIASLRADDSAVNAILDKSMKALGGEEKLKKVDVYVLKAKGTISFNGNDNEFTSQATVSGLDKIRAEFEGEFDGNKIKGVTVLKGDKGWRKFGDNVMEMDSDAVANEKRTLYLQVLPFRLDRLKGKDYKLESAGEEKVGDKPAIAVKITGPDGKDFKVFFDKKSDLPVRIVAKVIGFNGEEFTQETTLSDYKEFGGLKKPTKIESKRDGEKFISQEVTDFKVVDKVADDTFAEPA